jgi:hypothetical protein
LVVPQAIIERRQAARDLHVRIALSRFFETSDRFKIAAAPFHFVRQIEMKLSAFFRREDLGAGGGCILGGAVAAVPGQIMQAAGIDEKTAGGEGAPRKAMFGWLCHLAILQVRTGVCAFGKQD